MSNTNNNTHKLPFATSPVMQLETLLSGTTLAVLHNLGVKALQLHDDITWDTVWGVIMGDEARFEANYSPPHKFLTFSVRNERYKYNISENSISAYA